MLRLRRRFSMLAVAGVVAALGPALHAAPALAAVPGGVLPLSAETNFDSTVYKSVKVFCPSGMQVIGGAYQLVGAEGAVVLDDFIPSADNLLVGAGEIVGPGEASDGTTRSWKVVATVECANALAAYSVQPNSSNFIVATDQSARAVCPPGRAVIGGGASLSNGFGQASIKSLFIDSTFVQADAVADADGYSGAWSVTAYAICAAAPLPGWHVVQAASFAGISQIATAFCPGGQIPVGTSWTVGTTMNPKTDQYITRSTISTDPDPGVTTAAVSIAGRRDWSLGANAVCINPL
jgi:hypothetical protein